MGNDIYMGGVRFTPDFDDMGAPQEQWHELSGGSGKGKVMIALAYQPSTVSSALVYSIGAFCFCLYFPAPSRVIPPPSRLNNTLPFLDFWGCKFSDSKRSRTDPGSGVSPHGCAASDIYTYIYAIPVCSPC